MIIYTWLIARCFFIQLKTNECKGAVLLWQCLLFPLYKVYMITWYKTMCLCYKWVNDKK